VAYSIASLGRTDCSANPVVPVLHHAAAHRVILSVCAVSDRVNAKDSLVTLFLYLGTAIHLRIMRQQQGSWEGMIELSTTSGWPFGSTDSMGQLPFFGNVVDGLAEGRKRCLLVARVLDREKPTVEHLGSLMEEVVASVQETSASHNPVQVWLTSVVCRWRYYTLVLFCVAPRNVEEVCSQTWQGADPVSKTIDAFQGTRVITRLERCGEEWRVWTASTWSMIPCEPL